mmetsp:Transcript_21757/g.28512  ORF Transcript_21757/g.28512 Transcript_21757/m.28512 type:complete len:338 (-) Transcript_21757:333-1346(-)
MDRVVAILQAKKIDILAISISCTLLGIGAAIMNALERPNERAEYEAFAEYEAQVIAQIKSIFNSTGDPDWEAEYSSFWTQFQNYSSARASAPSLDALSWEFSGSAFFAMTVMTTIGYGTFAPSTDGGKVFTIFYALIAIPTFAFTLAVVSEGLKNAGKKISYMITNRFFIHPGTDQDSAEFKHKHMWGFIGLSVFCFFSILVFAEAFKTAYTDWSYLDSVYFNIITLSTVGLGDYAPTPDSGSSAKIAAFAFFIILGLAAVGSMIAVIQDSITAATEGMVKKASMKKLASFASSSNSSRKWRDMVIDANTVKDSMEEEVKTDTPPPSSQPPGTGLGR